MKRLTKRGMRLGLITVGIAALLVVLAAPGAATDPFKFKSDPQARGYLAHGSLEVESGGDVVVVKTIVSKGGSSGWHSHPGGAIVILKKGKITTYRSVRSVANNDDEDRGGAFHCVITTYDASAASKAFIEIPGEALNAENIGNGEAEIWAVFPGVTHPNGSPRTDVSPNPGTCPGH